MAREISLVKADDSDVVMMFVANALAVARETSLSRPVFSPPSENRARDFSCMMLVEVTSTDEANEAVACPTAEEMDAICVLRVDCKLATEEETAAWPAID